MGTHAPDTIFYIFWQGPPKNVFFLIVVYNRRTTVIIDNNIGGWWRHNYLQINHANNSQGYNKYMYDRNFQHSSLFFTPF